MKCQISLLCVGVCVLSACSSHSSKEVNNHQPKELNVKLETSQPSYKDIFERIEAIKLESNPQSLIGFLDKAICVNDSMIILDAGRSTIFLFSPEGKFLNNIGKSGDGPEDYIMCYDISYNSSTHTVSVLEPFGTLNDYSLNGSFIEKHKLPSKPNYMACEWMDGGKLALWSAVNEDESGVSVVDVKSCKTVFEDWKRDRMLDMRRLRPFYRYGEEVKFCPPLTNDVYSLSDTCLSLNYTWKFSPNNISEEYLNEIATIENLQEKNQRLIDDSKNGELKDVPSFNGETRLLYYVALQTGIGEESRYLSVFYDKKNDKSIVFNQFKEGMSLHPLFMNEKFMLCQIPYDEVDLYNDLLGLNITCDEDENPILAKFYFKK
ncbi:MAG: 6-bladed beta-propeller [Muribaculaceae bacterium]|nr:6-bladed beta-propeller [Muribaculaceae bacterium]